MAKKRVRRTKEQIEADKNTKSKGLGDTVEKVFKATGIDKVAKFILGEDCGCDERKQLLNQWFPYPVNCLTEDQYKWTDNYYKSGLNQIDPKLQKEFLDVYNYVFSTNHEPTNCSDCFKTWHKQLYKVYKTYENEK